MILVNRWLLRLTRRVSIHSTAIVRTISIGEESRVWAFCNIGRDVVIGNNANICDRCFIEDGVRLGDRVTLKTGVSLWRGVVVEDDVFIGPGVQFCNDLFPRSKCLVEPVSTLLSQGCSLGAGSVILPGVTIGAYAMVGAGAVVTRSVPDRAVVVGNPARIVRMLSE